MLRLLTLSILIGCCLILVACGGTADVFTPSTIENVTPSPTPFASSSISISERIEANAVVLYTRQVEAKPFLLLASPDLPLLQRPEFSDIYGTQPGIGYHFDNFYPELSATGRYLIIPGVGGAGPEGPAEIGAGTWLADLNTDDIQQLWSSPTRGAWSPQADQLAYVQEEMLYVKTVDDEAQDRNLLTAPGLSGLFLEWSPDGQQIATVSSVTGETTDGSYPPITDTVWLVSPDDASARALATLPGYPIEHSRHDLQWSPDGRFLLASMVVPTHILGLEGQQYTLQEGAKGLAWVPNQSNLLVRQGRGLSIINHQGQAPVPVTDGEWLVTAWAFSNDGRYLAYSYEQGDKSLVDIHLFDLQALESNLLTSVPASIVSSMYWTPNNELLVFDDGNDNTPIWAAEVETGNLDIVIEQGLLITVVLR